MGSAKPTSLEAKRIIRRRRKRGSSSPSSMRASQQSEASAEWKFSR
jgi:hypothetical protein